MNTASHTAASMCFESAIVALEGMATGDDSDESKRLIAAAHVKLAELRAVMSLAAGDELSFDPRLSPLARAIDDFVRGLDAGLANPIDFVDVCDDDREEQFQAALAGKEAAERWLDQARITGVLLLAHLSEAMKSLPNSTNV